MSTDPTVPSDDETPDADAAYCATLDAVAEIPRALRAGTTVRRTAHGS